MLVVLSLILVFCLAGLGTAFAEDNGTYHGNNKATISEKGVNVEYNTVCVDKSRSIGSNEAVKTKDQITTREGVVDYVVDKWQRNISKDSSQYTKFQEGVWNISEDTNRDTVSYPDFYKVNKTYESDKIVTIEERDGLNWTVTKWTSYLDEFTFRMTGDGWNVGRQDLLLFIVTSFDYQHETAVQIPPIVPPIEEEVIPPIVTPEEDTNTTSDDDTPVIVNPESPAEEPATETTTNTGKNTVVTPAAPASGLTPQPGPQSSEPEGLQPQVPVTETTTNVVFAATMKKTGLPIIPALLILIASFAGIGIRKKIKL